MPRPKPGLSFQWVHSNCQTCRHRRLAVSATHVEPSPVFPPSRGGGFTIIRSLFCG